MEDSLAMLTADNWTLKKQVSELRAVTRPLEDHMENFEGRSRCNHTHIIGVPEHSVGPAVDLFVEDFILKVLQPRGLFKYFSGKEAHRIPGTPPKPGAPPQHVIACIFNFRDVILQAAQSALPITHENAVTAFFPDSTLKDIGGGQDLVLHKHRQCLVGERLANPNHDLNKGGMGVREVVIEKLGLSVALMAPSAIRNPHRVVGEIRPKSSQDICCLGGHSESHSMVRVRVCGMCTLVRFSSASVATWVCIP
ncbi:hypothetical protein NDU88_002011 [Pleurodeles waltl]|uniref:Uncharacterized protein n=1 Tax=Pleurodeles waltl TaxID=8319 RepID=A0AAV7MLF1_PLEWA|nr:hypothetical protein NDU88_002011 [Pleurodeles waltl]